MEINTIYMRYDLLKQENLRQFHSLFSILFKMYCFVIREFLRKVLRTLLNLRGAHMTRTVSSTAKTPAATFLGERITSRC